MFNNVAKQLTNYQSKTNIGLKAIIPDNDNEEMNFLYENNLPKHLKSKRSVASFAAKP